MKLLISAIGSIVILLLLIFVIWKNKKDKQQYEQQLNDDFHKSKEQEGDAEPEDRLQ
jgi:FtsZ-interacting cell division protein ZipA